MSAFSFATRRGFLRILGMAPAAVPFAKTEAAGLLAKAEPLAAAAALVPQPIEMPGEKALGKLIAGQARDLKAQFDAEEYWRFQMREDGIDYDIACLRSTSRAWKCMKMAERHREHHGWVRRIEKVLWG